MKALTICQPYAQYIVEGSKRVENRTWPTRYRGPLAIHAGKNREWITDPEVTLKYPHMPFGAVVATCNLVECIQARRIEMGEFDKRYPWLKGHLHTFGPWCWVLDEVKPIGVPVPFKGAQGLWEFPVDSPKEPPCK
jgi:hypothetical protein